MTIQKKNVRKRISKTRDNNHKTVSLKKESMSFVFSRVSASIFLIISSALFPVTEAWNRDS